MPQETKSSPGLPLNGVAAPAADSLSVAGLTANLGSDSAAMIDILEKAFDFRGDVTLTLKNGSTVSGYLFDRRRGGTLADSYIRLMPPPRAGAREGENEKVRVAYSDIAHIAFSDRDPAAGKSFETWVKKYVEKKIKGEKASIESETLD
ncbi:MAG: hypothetical protein KF699_05100 [Phycisphaeraceae bacterium]|nr:hypothetical protein [Phycisphaeraceae bacterium]